MILHKLVQVLAMSFALQVSARDFSPVYSQGEPGSGIGRYDLRSPADRVFALDYESSGNLDHLALYRPGTGTFWILRKDDDGQFTPVYRQGDPGRGIGGFDLKHANDAAFAFDYESTGKLDHIVLYRPGFGAIFIVKRQPSGLYKAVYAQGHNGAGIGGYDLRSANDKMFAFDYNHSGRLDHLAIYRPGTGTMWILRRTRAGWSPVYQQGDPGSGIGGYDLRSPADRAFALDWNSNGKMDHMALYRPGTGTFWVLRNRNGVFTPVYQQGDPGSGIGGYDLRSPRDVAMAFDWDRSGKNDHVALYRPGTGTLWVVRRDGGLFTPVFSEGDPGRGVGGYDLKSRDDKVLALDYDGSGRADHLVLYRSNGSGTIWILRPGGY